VPAQYRRLKGRLLAALAASIIITPAFATQSLADKKNDPTTTTPIKHLVIISAKTSASIIILQPIP